VDILVLVAVYQVLQLAEAAILQCAYFWAWLV
jgi:hypothetical protein